MNSMTIITATNPVADVARLTVEKNALPSANVSFPAKDIDYPLFNENGALSSSSSQSKAEYDSIRGLENITIINNIMKAVYGQDSYYGYCIYQ